MPTIRKQLTTDDLNMAQISQWLNDNQLPEGNTFLAPGSVGPALIGQITPNYVTPTLLNSWTNFGSPWQTCAFFQDPFGFVHLLGALKGGAAGSIAFVLPAGLLPGEERAFAAGGASGAAAGCTIDTSGNVSLAGASVTSFVSIDGISFFPVQ